MRRPAYLEIVVVVGVFGTFGLCAMKLSGFGHHAREPATTVLALDAGAVEAAPPAATVKSSLGDILAKLQKGQPLTLDEQRELDRLARENGSGAAIATAPADQAPDADPESKTIAKDKKKNVKTERRMAALGDMSGAELVANLKGAGKPEDKSDAFVKAAFPNLTAEQQKTISAGIVKKAAASKKDGPAATDQDRALFDLNMTRAAKGLAPVDHVPTAVPVPMPGED